MTKEESFILNGIPYHQRRAAALGLFDQEPPLFRERLTIHRQRTILLLRL
jgi:hypothetical protein